jgi:amino acid transporter
MILIQRAASAKLLKTGFLIWELINLILRNLYWAQHIVAMGEIVTLPLVVLISFLAQPRLQYALAEDGLLPPIFSETDSHGNLRKGIIISGIGCTLIACKFLN